MWLQCSVCSKGSFLVRYSPDRHQQVLSVKSYDEALECYGYRSSLGQGCGTQVLLLCYIAMLEQLFREKKTV